MKITRSRIVTTLLGLLIIFISVVVVPGKVLPRDFDRNAAPEFIALSFGAALVAVYFVLSRHRARQIPQRFFGALLILMVASAFSLINSHNVIGGIIGDAGRYTGLASLCALILFAIFTSTLKLNEFRTLLYFLIAASVLVDLLGIAQSFNWISLPGDGGIGSTLGNLDFLSAWIGTSFALALINKPKRKLDLILILGLLGVSIVLMLHIGAKQGFVDLILLIPAAIIYLLRKKIHLFGLGIAGITAVISTLAIFWFELIYILPMSHLPIPGLAGDPNIRIRTDFWYAGFKEFAHHFFWGVGPDNYGYYYEQSRSLSSVKLTESVLSNDAHSASVQTLATLGIFGMLAFVILLVLFIRSLVVIGMRPEGRWLACAIGLFATIYLTNATVSPITLPNKLLFWVVAGFACGFAERLSPRKQFARPGLIRIFGVALAALVLFASTNFASSSLDLYRAKSGYRPSIYLPCTFYFSMEISAANLSPQKTLEYAAKEAAANPRCLEAQSLLANGYIALGQLDKAKGPIYQLLEIAPGRKAVVRLAAIYAIKAKDMQLQRLLVSQGVKLGVLTS